MANVLWMVLIGLAAGWLATRLMKHRELNLVGNLVLGVIGALIGGFVFGLLGFVAVGLLARLLSATLGAMALIWLVGYLNAKKA